MGEGQAAGEERAAAPADRRRERSAETRRRVLEAAHGLFVRHGYAGTTVESIAREAGLAVQTIYFKFGNKQTILRELFDVQMTGDDEPLPPLERPWFYEALAAATAAGQLRLQVERAGGVYERVGPLLEVLRHAAVASEEVAELWARYARQRYEVQTRLMRALAAKHPLAPGLTPARAADIAYGLLAPDLYRLLVVERGWSPAEWGSWTHAALRGQLLGGTAAEEG